MSLLSELYKIQKKDLKNAVIVLNDAFSEESMWKEVFNDEEKNRIFIVISTGYVVHTRWCRSSC